MFFTVNRTTLVFPTSLFFYCKPNHIGIPYLVPICINRESEGGIAWKRDGERGAPVHGTASVRLLSHAHVHTLRRHGSQKARATGPRGYAKHPNVSAHTRTPAKEYLCCVRLCTALPHLPGNTATSSREHCHIFPGTLPHLPGNTAACGSVLHCFLPVLYNTTHKTTKQLLHIFLSFVFGAAVLRP